MTPAATATAPGDAARAAAIDSLARIQAAGEAGPTAATTAAALPSDSDLDALMGRVIDRARLSVGAAGTSLTTEFHDPALGALRLAVTEDGTGLIRAVLTAGDPVSAALLQQAADRHRAAGELASVDLRVRSEWDAGRDRDPRGGSATGGGAGAAAFNDGRRPDRDDQTAQRLVEPPLARPIRARRVTNADHQPRSSRLGRTLDRTA